MKAQLLYFEFRSILSETIYQIRQIYSNIYLRRNYQIISSPLSSPHLAAGLYLRNTHHHLELTILFKQFITV